jgi:uncharacterized cofD-like protein
MPNPPSPGLRCAAIGGGTGLSALLHGLKNHVLGGAAATALSLTIQQLTAVVTVMDDGGSSGRLRRDLKVLPPGDIRNCLVALAEDEALTTLLFRYRFPRGRGLRGHSFGNLFLAALTRITGDFNEAVRVSSEVLRVRGDIFPATMTNVTLEADLAGGGHIAGESRIGRARRRIARVRLVPEECYPLPETLRAIAQADVITLGPGSLFTSLVPNVLVKGVAEAIAASPASKVFVCNLMTQPGETLGFSAADHIQAIYSHCHTRLFDYAILNTGAISPALVRRYEKQRAKPVVNDLGRIKALGIQPLAADLVSEQGLVRHHPERLARLVLETASKRRVLHARC